MNRRNPTVSVVIVSFNTRELTIECLRTVFKECSDWITEVIVVDNSSTDGSADAIAHQFPRAKLIKSTENLGFAKANNLAVQRSSGEFVLLLNPDTLILNDAISRLVEFARQNPDAGIWGGRTVFADGSLNPSSCWRFMSVTSLSLLALGISLSFRNSAMFNPEAYGGWNRDSVRDVDIVSGCFFLIDRDLWSKLGGMDERFFMYAEEADLCFRAAQLGAHPKFTPEATIVHYGGASERIRADKHVRLFSGKITFIRKHWGPIRKFAGIRVLKLHALVRYLAYNLLCKLDGCPKYKKAAIEWKEIWQSRKLWTIGYTL